MSLPVIADVIRCSVFGTVEGGVAWSNTFHVKKDNANTFTDTIADLQVQVALLYSIAGFGGTDFGWGHYATDGSVVTSMIYTPLDGATSSKTFAVSIAGTSSQEPLPPQNAIAITINTGLRGRSKRGRVFWACTSREVMTGAKLGAANVTMIESAWEAFQDATDAMAHPAHLGVASYKLGSFQVATAEAPVTCRSVYAHQSKRRGRGA
jgi:hypothetical protein